MIKKLALDVFGTIVSTRDGNLPARKGLNELFDYCDSHKIQVFSSSDADNDYVKQVLSLSGVDISRFTGHRQFQIYPKEFHYLISENPVIKGHELLVLGDRLDADIDGAVEIGARYIQVWVYEDLGDWDKYDFSWTIDAIIKADKVPRMEFDLTRFAVTKKRKSILS